MDSLHQPFITDGNQQGYTKEFSVVKESRFEFHSGRIPTQAYSPMPTLYTCMTGICLLLSLVCCQQRSDHPARDSEMPLSDPSMQEPSPIYPERPSVEVHRWGQVEVEIRMPDTETSGCLVLLPGWNFSRQDWCQNSTLCTQAQAQGLVLILPEMGKSLYTRQLYPETRADWRGFPTLAWVLDTLIPRSQKLGLLKRDQRNFIAGISTGARGALRVLAETDTLFRAGVLLSGDYMPEDMPRDNLMRGYCGPLEQFPQRWKETENPSAQLGRLQAPLYVGHGNMDRIVPVSQSVNLFAALQSTHPKLIHQCRLHTPDAGHNYTYWEGETDNILAFLAEF